MLKVAQKTKAQKQKTLKKRYYVLKITKSKMIWILWVAPHGCMPPPNSQVMSV